MVGCVCHKFEEGVLCGKRGAVWKEHLAPMATVLTLIITEAEALRGKH
jgi:hypothetical protein